MVRLFILIKRKGSKRFLGAIPTRKGATMASLRRIMPKQIKKGFTFKIVTEKQLKKIILLQRPRAARRLIRRVRRKGKRRRRAKSRRMSRRLKRRIRRKGRRFRKTRRIKRRRRR